MKTALLFLLALVSACAAHAQAPANCTPGTNVYYIDNVGGSDSNTQTQAKVKATAWAHHPRMKSFTGTYSPSAGDCFYFKGGDTWVYTDYPFKWTSADGGSLSGTTCTSRTYAGWGDQTWGTG